MDALQALLSRVKRKDPATLASVVGVAALLVVVKWASNKAKPRTKFITNFADVVSQGAGSEYDVVVVGGGTAGCVLASRLSEDPSIKVLLLEAGQSAAKLPFAIIPSAYSNFWLGQHEWSLYTEPQEHAASRKLFWPRGKILGGCTNMNAMMYHYGAPTDYDEWASLQKGQAGGSEWSYKEFNPYFHKFERYNPSQQYPNVDVSLRGSQGPVNIGYNGYFGPYSQDFISSCIAAGIEPTDDMNTYKGSLGVGRVMTYINAKGQRVTSERSYLTPEVLARPNLKVAIGAHVTRILFDTEQKTRATGVEFRDNTGATFVAKAAKEVILAAGAVHTPHILMLSGVGPVEHLSSVGVPVVADLPGVGSNLKDHVVVDLNYMDKFKQSLTYLEPSGISDTLRLMKTLLQYQTMGKGPLASNLSEAAGFVRTDDTKVYPLSKYPKESLPEDTTSGEGCPDVEIFVTCVAYTDVGLGPHPAPGNATFATHAVCLRPKSTGTIRLRSRNPTDAPIIDPRYLEDENDVKILIRGLRLLDDIAHKEPFVSRLDPAGKTFPELKHDLSKDSDTDLEHYVRNNVQTLFHPACTARMAPLEDGGVVDPQLRVHGIPNLRIADASVFPSIVAGHTTAPVYAIAEKASDLIRRDIGQRSTKV